MKHKFYFIIFFTILIFSGININDYTPRGNYNAKLEIKDKIIHGAGQSNHKEYMDYFNAMPDNAKPLIYMCYVNIKYYFSAETFIKKLKDLLIFYENKNIYIIPQIGLEMTLIEKPEMHYEDEVAEGKHDEWLEKFCVLFKELQRPAFVRIGYEFNGSWNGYNPVTYKKAFKKVTDKFRKHKLDIATVWCAAPPLGEYMQYYPGDEYVDWWSVNVFGENDILSNEVDVFMKRALKHNKPVIIGESTPVNIGVLKGKESWDRWYSKYFKLMRKHKNLKAFSYINCDWSKTHWSNWGDSRIEKNKYVQSRYIEEVSNPVFFNGTDEKSYKKELGIIDNMPTKAVLNLKADLIENQVELKWNNANNKNEDLRYLIYIDNIIKDYTIKEFYIDKDLKAGNTLSYVIQAVDNAGNRGSLSGPVKIKIPDSINKVINGDFENDESGWTVMGFNGGELFFDIEEKNPISGKKSARIVIKNSTGTNWHAQFAYQYNSYKGMNYDLSFKIRSSKNISFDLFTQQAHDPYYSLFYKKINAGVKVSEYEIKNIGSFDDDNINLTFMFGDVDKGTVIWIDDVVLMERK